jgi:hypothetical protein
MMRVVLPFALLLVALVAGCPTPHDGRLMLVVTSDIPAPDLLAAVRVEVGSEVRDIQLGPGASQLPFSLAIDARSGRPPREPVSIVVSGLASDRSVLVSRPVTTTFVPGRTLTLLVDLARRCTPFAGCSGQLTCEAGQACTVEGCVSPEVESETLHDVLVPGDELGAAASYTPAEACAAFGEIECNAILGCCPYAERLSAEELESLRVQCLDTYAQYCTDTILPILEDPRTAFDPVRAAAVMREGRELAEDCELRFADWAQSYERGVFSALRGTIPRGGACVVADAPGFFSCRDSACLPSDSGFACAPRACLGEPCSDDTEEGDAGCGDELFCAAQGDGFACAALRIEGSPCTRDSQCVSQICLGEERPSGEGVCAVRNATNVFCPMTSM